MGSVSGAQLKNPATGETIGYLRKGNAEDVKAAVEEARAAQPMWASLSIGKRTRYIRAMRDYIAGHADEISAIISRSTGKTRIDALSTEVLPSAMAAAYYSKIASRIHRPSRVDGGNILFFNKASYITRVPFGVVGIISPWNYPFSIPFYEVIMALLAGNAVVLKVATQTQAVGDCLAEMVAASGLPAGVFTLVHAPGAVAGTAMLAAGVNKLFFTGSTSVGRELMAKAGATLTPVVLELGGNDAMIVLDDAGAERAAGGAAWAGLSNAGQSCAGVERVFVCPGIYDEFKKRLVRIVENLRVGADAAFDVDIGSLTQADLKRKVDTYVADAVKKGAVVLCRKEADDGEGLFSPVLVLENVDDSMLVMKDEVFGPVLAVQKVRDEEEAVRLANSSPYGLSASVWSRSPRHARRIAERLEAGTVTINDHLMSHGLAETPWGGFKNSGIGRSHGEIGFLEMSQPRVIVRERLHRIMPRNMWWYPHDKKLYNGLKGALHLLYGKGLFSRLGAVPRLVATFMRSFWKGY